MSDDDRSDRNDSLRSPAFIAEMDQAYGDMKADLDFLTKLAALQLNQANGDMALATGWTVRMIFEQPEVAERSERSERWLRAHLGAALVRLADLTRPDLGDLDGHR